MTSMSKIFYEVSSNKTCKDFWHPGKSCKTAIFDVVISVFPGSYKFYLPLLLIPPLLKTNWTTSKDACNYILQHFLEYSAISWRTYLQAVIGLGSNCVLCKIFGKLHYFTAMALPGFLSALLVPKLSQQHLRLQAITFFNMMLEVLIRKSNIGFISRTRKSKVVGTLLFMTHSAIILHILKNTDTKHIWLIMPTKVNHPKQKLSTDRKDANFSRTERIICSHMKSCGLFFIDGIYKYFLIGIILEASRAIISNLPAIFAKPTSFINVVGNNVDFSLPIFLSSYIGIFRILECILTQTFQRKSTAFSTIAGFISGISYCNYPKYQVFTLCLTKSVEMSWDFIVLNSKYGRFQKFIDVIEKLPVLKTLHMVSIGFMYHTAVFYSHLSPLFNNKALNLCSNNRVNEARKNYISWILDDLFVKYW